MSISRCQYRQAVLFFLACYVYYYGILRYYLGILWYIMDEYYGIRRKNRSFSRIICGLKTWKLSKKQKAHPGESHMSHEKINPTWWIWCHPSDEAVPVFFQMVPPRSGNLMGI